MTDEFDELSIDLHLTVLVEYPTKIQRAFDFATAERGTRLLPKYLFFRSQILG